MSLFKKSNRKFRQRVAQSESEDEEAKDLGAQCPAKTNESENVLKDEGEHHVKTFIKPKIPLIQDEDDDENDLNKKLLLKSNPKLSFHDEGKI